MEFPQRLAHAVLVELLALLTCAAPESIGLGQLGLLNAGAVEGRKHVPINQLLHLGVGKAVLGDVIPVPFAVDDGEVLRMGLRVFCSGDGRVMGVAAVTAVPVSGEFVVGEGVVLLHRPGDAEAGVGNDRDVQIIRHGEGGAPGNEDARFARIEEVGADEPFGEFDGCLDGAQTQAVKTRRPVGERIRVITQEKDVPLVGLHPVFVEAPGFLFRAALERRGGPAYEDGLPARRHFAFAQHGEICSGAASYQALQEHRRIAVFPGEVQRSLFGDDDGVGTLLAPDDFQIRAAEGKQTPREQKREQKSRRCFLRYCQNGHCIFSFFMLSLHQENFCIPR